MIEALKQAVDKISALPDDAQEYAASVLLQIAAESGGVYRISDAEHEDDAFSDSPIVKKITPRATWFNNQTKLTSSVMSNPSPSQLVMQLTARLTK